MSDRSVESEMFPASSSFDVADHAEGHTIFRCDISISQLTSENLPDLSFREFCIWVQRTYHRLYASLSSLIGGIVGIGSQEQMGRIAAWRIVAVMQHAFVPLPFRMRELIGDAMGETRLAAPCDSTVTQRGSALSPLPTVTWAATANIRPKAFSLITHPSSLSSQLRGGNRK